MPEIKYDRSHHAGATPEARIKAREQNSGAGTNPDVHVQTGDGARRTHHNVHLAAGHLRPPAGPTSGFVQKHRESEVSGGESAKVGGVPTGRGGWPTDPGAGR